MLHFSEMTRWQKSFVERWVHPTPPLNLATFMSPHDKKTIYDSKVQINKTPNLLTVCIKA